MRKENTLEMKETVESLNKVEFFLMEILELKK